MMIRRLLLVGLLALAGLSGCTNGPATAAPVFQIIAVQDRQPAPELGGELVDGSGTYDPSRHAGELVVVNVWGSWCGPCVTEAPELEAVLADRGDAGVAFLGINVRDDDPDSARAFARQYLTFPSIYDPSSRLVLGFPIHPSAVPSTIVLDRQGRVAAVAQRPVTRFDLDAVVEQLLEEAT